MNIVYFILLGAAAGWLSGKIIHGSGFGAMGNIIVGVLGGIIGGWVFGKLGVSTGGGLLGSLATSVIGAVILVYLLSFITRK